ncbi:MAG TPA: DUF2064 domain-containing protein, partial [Gammaproteobacteria bacterium]|nr:DUF2064 domain-containing protein [Gammaproteobacteria bacterium]
MAAQVTSEAKVIVFAKAPEPGKTKTRLIPKLGADGAARLHEKLIRHAVAIACAAQLGPVELWCTPSSAHPVFAELATAHAIALREQPPGDLGSRMHAALVGALATNHDGLLIGSECLDYAADYLLTELDALDSGDD